MRTKSGVDAIAPAKGNCEVTIKDLIDAGFPETVVTAVIALTRLPGMSRMDAARMAAAHPIARVVKIADLEDNMRLDRIPCPTAKDHARIAEYRAAWDYLNQPGEKTA